MHKNYWRFLICNVLGSHKVSFTRNIEIDVVDEKRLNITTLHCVTYAHTWKYYLISQNFLLMKDKTNVGHFCACYMSFTKRK